MQGPMCDAERDWAALIAEKLRLAEELGARTRELTETAVEHHTATSEILRVISTSPVDLQPVLNAVAESAARSGSCVTNAPFEYRRRPTARTMKEDPSGSAIMS
jgi:hypothetical protein